MNESTSPSVDPEDSEVDKPSQAEGGDSSASGSEHEVLPQDGKPSQAEG